MGPHNHNTDGAPDADDDETRNLAELLDLDAEVLHSYLSDVTTWVRHLAADTACRRVMDLGAGTGTGTIALARRFLEADVIAVDSSEEMLARIRVKALDLGIADRVDTVQADLDATWPAIEPVDVVWASMSLHHMTEPDQVLDNLFATIRSGGILAVAEIDAPLRFLPEEIGLGSAGLEARCHAALAQEHADSVPHLGSDWGPRLDQAGFTSIAKRTFTIDLDSPPSTSTRRFAHGAFMRMYSALEGRLTADDVATLDTLMDSHGPDGLLHRNDIVVRGTRTAWIGRRP